MVYKTCTVRKWHHLRLEHGLKLGCSHHTSHFPLNSIQMYRRPKITAYTRFLSRTGANARYTSSVRGGLTQKVANRIEEAKMAKVNLVPLQVLCGSPLISFINYT